MADDATLESLKSRFFALAFACQSLVFARAEPWMKKTMATEIMARAPNAVVLAIGDGANDTDMVLATP